MRSTLCARRTGSLSRAFDFLEAHEPTLHVDCDWMLGAAVTAQIHQRTNPLLSDRARAMSTRLLSRWCQRPPATGPTFGPATLPTLRRSVLDTFAGTLAHSIAEPTAIESPKIYQAALVHAQVWARSQGLSLYQAMFGLCPISDTGTQERGSSCPDSLKK